MPNMSQVLKVEGYIPRSCLQDPLLVRPRRGLRQVVGSELRLSSSSYLQAYLFWTFLRVNKKTPDAAATERFIEVIKVEQ